MPSRLAASVVLPEDSAWNAVELRLLVENQGLIDTVFDAGSWADPDKLLVPDT